MSRALQDLPENHLGLLYSTCKLYIPSDVFPTEVMKNISVFLRKITLFPSFSSFCGNVISKRKIERNEIPRNYALLMELIYISPETHVLKVDLS